MHNHNPDDLIKVKSILRQYGYQTSVNNGYMVLQRCRSRQKLNLAQGRTYTASVCTITIPTT